MGITQQRLIKQNNASRDCLHALEELMRRIHLQLENDPTNFSLQILSAIKPLDLLENPDTLIDIAVEAENIRLTRAHNDQRRNLAKRRLIESSPPTIPNLEDNWSTDQLFSSIEKDREPNK